ncbi:hypothetical protein NEFER03_0523 [Nematocida sp. LUAm3]|nr:hypothetical protein NEFER03_0523 [Nematocida sp. LUAm3]KAI5175490.1 hypothetical protein NEFER02_1396 [Nematocida sp. LUAm2]KAI5178480.1 hypothetical protein NEFER01_1627 [Nematocida sp. LUAm1]
MKESVGKSQEEIRVKEEQRRLEMREGMDATELFLSRILRKEEREKEKDQALIELSELDKELEKIVKENPLEIMSDLDKTNALIKGVTVLNRKIDEAEEIIEINSMKQKEIKKEADEIKTASERVEEAVEITEKLEELLEVIGHLDKISSKCMIRIENCLNKRVTLTDEDIRYIYLWSYAIRKTKTDAEYFSKYAFYTKLCNIADGAEDRLVAVANLVTQWWICEHMAGIQELAIRSEEKEKSYACQQIQESRKFAMQNKTLIQIGKYIYEEIKRKEEFAAYVNSARKREITKLCKISSKKSSASGEVEEALRMFKDFLLLDAEIRKIFPQGVDPAQEEYDPKMKRKIENILDVYEPETIDNEKVLKHLKKFFGFLRENDIYFKELIEIVVQQAYALISGNSEEVKEKMKKTMHGKNTLKEKLEEASSCLFLFFRETQMLISGVEQAENELDEITLKCINEILRVIRELLSDHVTQKEALVLKGFTQGIRSTIEKEHSLGKSHGTFSIDQQLPELKNLEKQEEEILQRTESELEDKMKEITRKIKVKIDTSDKTTKCSLYPSQVSKALEEYKGKVSPEFMSDKVNEVFGLALHYLPRLKTYSEISALETDFVILYKTVQYLSLENETVKRILKIFTDIDCIKKKKGKGSEDPVQNDLQQLFRENNI